MSVTADDGLADVISSLGSAERSAVIANLQLKLSRDYSSRENFTTAGVLTRILSRLDTATSYTNSEAGLDRSEDAVLDFIKRSIVDSAVTNITLIREIVEISLQYRKFADNLLRDCLAVLEGYVRRLASDTETLAVPSAHYEGETLQLGKPGPDTYYESYNDIAVLKSLTLLRVFSWCDGQINAQFQASLIQVLLVLLGATSSEISKSSHETLLSWLSKSTTFAINPSHKCLSNVERTSSSIWNRVLELCSRLERIRYSTIGCSLWASLVSSHGHCFPPRAVLYDEAYWTTLHRILSKGTAQQRKACLYILKCSLALLDNSVTCPSMLIEFDALDEARKHYARFSTLYETIVLARYLNQVEDCLADLTSIVQNGSSVQAAWWIALLSGALGSNSQDSIRKILGNWVLQQHGICVLREAPQLIPDFLVTCLLPWATVGHHYTASIRHTSTHTPVCEHGELLIVFLVQVLAMELVDDHRSSIVNAILSFLRSRQGQIYPYARVYLLQGLLQGISVSQYHLDETQVGDIVAMSTISAFNEMARDLMVLQCGSLASYFVRTTGRTSVVEPLSQSCSNLRTAPNPGSIYVNLEGQSQKSPISRNSLKGNLDAFASIEDGPDQHGVSRFNAWVRNTRGRCLAGKGLEVALAYLLRSLNGCGEEVEAEEVLLACKAIWEEYEIQEYPRKAAMLIPRVFLHPRCTIHSTGNTPLQSFLHDALIGMQRIADHRVYAFWSFGAALRKAVLQPTHAVSLPLADLLIHFANIPPITKVEFTLEGAIAPMLVEYATFRTYNLYYGKSAGYGLASMFDMLNKLPKIPCNVELRRKILDALLDPWIHQKRPVPVFSKWKATSQLQTILILMEGLLPDLDDSLVDSYFLTLHDLLASESLPRYRFLLEWVIARIYVLQPKRRPDVLHELREPDLSNSKNVVSYMKLALMIARLADSCGTFAFDLMTEFVTLAASPKIVIRHEAQWTVPILWHHCELRDWRRTLDCVPFARLNSHIRGLDTYKNPPAGRQLESFDPVKDHTLSNLFQGEYLDIEPREEQRVTRDDFLSVWEDDRKDTFMTTLSGDVGLLPLGATRARRCLTISSESNDVPDKSMLTATSLVPLQTKASTWEDLGSPYSALTGSSAGRGSRNMIVVSSLIDNPFNLGGLSRLCEIFGVESLQVHNLRVIDNKDFTSVSVSSHRWLPIEQLKVEDIASYLTQHKLQGYTVVGIEQTDSSLVLGQDNWAFPEKIVLVLGSEREGIPAWLLAVMDVCMEIKQVGVTRSMNVQTAAAVVLYEYSRQRP